MVTKYIGMIMLKLEIPPNDENIIKKFTTKI